MTIPSHLASTFERASRNLLNPDLVLHRLVMMDDRHTRFSAEDEEALALACVAYVLDDGAEVDLVDHHGFTPLFYAGSPEMVELLMMRGADPDARPTRINVHMSAREALAQTDKNLLAAILGVELRRSLPEGAAKHGRQRL